MLLLLVSEIRKSFRRGGPFLLEDSPDLCEEVLRRLGALIKRAVRFGRVAVSFLGRKTTQYPNTSCNYGIFIYISLGIQNHNHNGLWQLPSERILVNLFLGGWSWAPKPFSGWFWLRLVLVTSMCCSNKMVSSCFFLQLTLTRNILP